MSAAAPRRGIAAGGTFVLDRVALVDRYPAEETIADIRAVALANGGLAYNALVDLARLGAPFPLWAIGLLGDDAEGARVRNDCKGLGIDARQLRTDGRASTSFSEIISVRPTGRRTIFHHRGANAYLDDEHFDFAACRARVLLLGFIGLLDRLDRPDRRYGTVAARVLARARAAGMLTAADVVSDLARLPALVPPALPYLDVLFLNELEAGALTRVRLRGRGGRVDRAAVARAARVVVGAGLRGQVVIHTAEGAGAFSSDQPFVWQGSVRVPPGRIVGTNGAGDAFAAGYLYGVHEGWTTERCLQAAACVAASSLTDGTPSAGVRPMRTCLALGQRHGYR